ncbi:MAG: sulfite exporter TauE/SafE family protein, partial [Sedimenticola sp.]|nr:sulfite exporter TauE/SafE family protein [Sedimenticola sp.]
MDQLLPYFSAFIVGLLGGVHCIGMCGGIVGALTFGLPEQKRQSFSALLPFQLSYNLGR